MKNRPQLATTLLPKINTRDLSNTIPGYKINEYLLALNPYEALRDKIMTGKNIF